jgi:glucosamine-6-phosphate deaminase
MEVIILATPKAAAIAVGQIIQRLLDEKPRAVLGLATGDTARLLYRELVKRHLDWSRVTTFNLDEYIGLPPYHPASYHRFMWENLFTHTNIKKKNVHIPDGLAKDLQSYCTRYETQIRQAGGIDLQVLGIGRNGHIGFNEPTSSLSSRTRVKTLAPQTRKDNARHFDGKDRIPRHVITMGIGTIMDARRCLLLACGKNKARILSGAVEGPITSMNPASILQLHPTARIVLDEAAASRLKRADYYRWVFQNKPTWQKAYP